MKAILALIVLTSLPLHADTCLGKTPCKACRTCKLCKWCNRTKGHTCGVCKKRGRGSRVKYQPVKRII